MEEVFEEYFDEFTKKHWDKIKSGLELNETQLETLKDEIRKLNPKPGASLGETDGRNMQQINPDFIVDTADDGTITFTLNRGNMPELTVSPSFTDMIETYKKHKDQMSRKDKEALLYAKEKVDKAQGFIEKYVQTKWGIFPLKFFFTDSYTTEDGEELSTRKIKIALQHLIENEDKKKPLSDDAISKVMKEKGFPIARRTVAKYREQLGIPVARLRK